MKPWLKFILLLIAGFAVAFGTLRMIPKQGSQFNYRRSTSSDSSDVSVIDWRILRELDYQSGEASQRLQALNGKIIRIPGFIVPLEDSQTEVSEFLLVPSPQACIHVPPPPPNQMLYVKMDKPVKFDPERRAIWAQGILNLNSVASPYGQVSFEMVGQSIKPFVFEPQKKF